MILDKPFVSRVLCVAPFMVQINFLACKIEHTLVCHGSVESIEQFSCEHLILTYVRDHKYVYVVLVGERPLGGYVMGRDHYKAMPCFKRFLTGLSLQKPGRSVRVL